MIISGCADDAVETSTTSTEPTTTTTANPGAELEAAFMTEIESLAAALDSGDLDTYLGLLQASLSDPELDRAAFFAVSVRPHVLVDECEILSVSDFVSDAVCPTEITDPVRLEFGPPEGGIQLLRYGDGLSPKGDGSHDVRQYTDSSTAYGSYLQQYMPDEYAAACDPDAYDREIRFEYGVTLTPECGELLAEVADDVAQWVRDGQPSP
jgi:hypothetical protein